MTANLVATLVESRLNDINIENNTNNTIYNYNVADGLLNEYTKMPYWTGHAKRFTFLANRFLNFEMTEMVYKHAKHNCEQRIVFDNWYRAYGWVHGDKLSAFNKFVSK